MQAAKAKRMNLALGRGSWHSHLKREHYEFRKACKRVDVCDICLDYERQFLPALRTAVQTVRSKLCSHRADYFIGFDSQWLGGLCCTHSVFRSSRVVGQWC